MTTTIKQVIESRGKDLVQIAKISNSNQYSLNRLKQYFKDYVDCNFKTYDLDDENIPVITQLLLYFSGNKEFENSPDIKNASLDKGILLAGNIGSGKTTLMRVLKDLRISETTFQIKSCREVAQLYVSEGIEAIQRFGIKAVKFEHGKWKNKHFLFDDLGTEKSVSHFGNKLNVMEEVLLDRYDHFVKHGLMTHLTTNLDLEELETTYGSRVMSRMHEMFNFIVLGSTKESKDRRIVTNNPIKDENNQDKTSSKKIQSRNEKKD